MATPDWRQDNVPTNTVWIKNKDCSYNVLMSFPCRVDLAKLEITLFPTVLKYLLFFATMALFIISLA